jgi:hypothetical protein
MMDSSVTGGTEGNNPPGVVGTVVGKTTDVVRFQVGTSVLGDKRRLALTPLTDAVCSGENVFPNRFTSSSNVLATDVFGSIGRSASKRGLPQLR